MERLALIPSEVRARLPAVAVAALERGVTRGGMPPRVIGELSAEPDDEHPKSPPVTILFNYIHSHLHLAHA